MPERTHHWVDGTTMASQVDDTGAKAEIEASHNYVWDTIGLTWVRMTQPGGVGGGGGGPATIADGADVAQGATSDTSAASTVVGILKAIKAAVQGTLTVATHAVTQSGVWTVARSWSLSSTTDSVNVGNFPATQPVSGTVGVNNFPASQAVTGTFFQATQPVSGTFFQATQPVSIAAAVDVSDRAARLLGVVDKGKVWDGTNIAAVKAASALAVATDPAFVVQHAPQRADASTLWVTALSAANTTVTLTLPAPAAGLFHYITHIEIVNLNPTVTAIAAAATTLSYTTTNLPGSPAFSCGNLLAAGATFTVANISPATPIKSSVAATATTFVAPAIGTGGLCRMNVTYYTAP